jgi:hypothetical protein
MAASQTGKRSGDLVAAPIASAGPPPDIKGRAALGGGRSVGMLCVGLSVIGLVTTGVLATAAAQTGIVPAPPR